MPDPVRLYVYPMKQDDPKKCTARKLVRFGKGQMHDRMASLPKTGLVLDPFAVKAMSPADINPSGRTVLVAVD